MSDRTKPARHKHSPSDKKTQWHMAITPAMKLEFMEYSQILDYVPERLLNTKALQIVSKSNRRLFETIKKEDQTMYSAFVELMQPEIDEAVNKAVAKAVEENME